MSENVRGVFDNVTAVHTDNVTCDNVTAGHFDDVTYENVTHCKVTVNLAQNDRISDSFEALMALAHFILSLVILVVNSLTMITHVRNKELKTIQNKYIISLASADFQVGCALVNLFFTDYFHEVTTIAQCRYILASLYVGVTVSLSNMLSVALDRYIYIVHPFAYRRLVTPTKTSLLILAQWTLAIAHGYMAAYIIKPDDPEVCNPFYAYRTASVRYFLPTIYFIASIVIGITYGLIAKIAKAHHDRKQLRARRIDNVLQARNAGNQSARAIEVNSGIGESREKTASLPQDCSGDVLGDSENGKDLKREELSKLEDVDNLIVRENLVEANATVLSPSGYFGSFDISQSVSEHDLTLRETTEKEFHIQQSMDVDVDTYSTLSKENRRNAVINSVGTAVETRPDRGSQSVEATEEVGECSSPKHWSLSSLRWMKQMVVVYGLFLVFWTPNMVYVLSSLFFHDINYKVVYILAFLGSANSAVNFFVYSLMSQQFRKAFKKTFTCQCKCKAVTQKTV